MGQCGEISISDADRTVMSFDFIGFFNAKFDDLVHHLLTACFSEEWIAYCTVVTNFRVLGFE